MNALTLNVPQTLRFTTEQFATLAQVNPDLRLELNATGRLLIMPPTGGETGDRNSELTGQLWYWNRQQGLGKVFDSSTGFRLPNGAIRSPDVSWLRRDRWDSLNPEERQRFLPLCPDFAVELLSPSDDLEQTRQKMQEYLDNGLRLGWLINPRDRTVEVFTQTQDVAILAQPTLISGDPVLPQFELVLGPVWNI